MVDEVLKQQPFLIFVLCAGLIWLAKMFITERRTNMQLVLSMMEFLNAKQDQSVDRKETLETPEKRGN